MGLQRDERNAYLMRPPSLWGFVKFPVCRAANDGACLPSLHIYSKTAKKLGVGFHQCLAPPLNHTCKHTNTDTQTAHAHSTASKQTHALVFFPTVLLQLIAAPLAALYEGLQSD